MLVNAVIFLLQHAKNCTKCVFIHFQALISSRPFITYNIKSLALTLSFPQAFKDATTERSVKFPRNFKHPEYYDIPKPHPWKSIIFKLWYHILSLESLKEIP